MGRQITRVIGLLALSLGIVACGSSPIKDKHGNSVYTQVGMWVDGNKHLTTNYSVGWFIPANTKVRITDSNAERIAVQVPSENKSFYVVNVPKYTQENIAGIYDHYFDASRVDMGQFSSKVQTAIRSGEVINGMSREAVLAARGYPPAHETSSLNNDNWTYWTNRFNRIRVEFDGGKVSDVVD